MKAIPRLNASRKLRVQWNNNFFPTTLFFFMKQQHCFFNNSVLLHETRASHNEADAQNNQQPTQKKAKTISSMKKDMGLILIHILRVVSAVPVTALVMKSKTALAINSSPIVGFTAALMFKQMMMMHCADALHNCLLNLTGSKWQADLNKSILHVLFLSFTQKSQWASTNVLSSFLSRFVNKMSTILQVVAMVAKENQQVQTFHLVSMQRFDFSVGFGWDENF